MTLKTSAALVALVLLAACHYETPTIRGGQYWQRARSSEAVYQQGPKAQQMLNRDIGRCVTELRELERLGSLKHSIPTDQTGKTLNPDEKPIADWDTPEYKAQILTGQKDYRDFDGCMVAKGWQRVYIAGDHLTIRTRDDVAVPVSSGSPDSYVNE